ncbi:GDSL-type esterase/lipase family protein [Colwellia sp. 20A7]|uniref:GDSL-type esterase/lipase family protein n=1 Tax=Colwellia sp. 20A7 TaxID=2689569 RepID=UPI001359E5A8|nr:GDSL-type esterase/lipase family protein [Colwellia sp. 20A7]
MFKKTFISLVITSVFIINHAIAQDKPLTSTQANAIKNTPEKKIYKYDGNLAHQKLFDGLSKNYDVVFLGDSLTNGGRWSEAFIEKRVANRGIGGDTSQGILNRVDKVIALNPKTVYLMLGINDIMHDKKSAYIFERYKKIITKLTHNKINVIVQSTLLTAKPELNNEVAILNKKLLAYTKQLNLPYIDLNKDLAPSGILTDDITRDGIHLRAEVYLKWFDIIRKSGHI